MSDIRKEAGHIVAEVPADRQRASCATDALSHEVPIRSDFAKARD